MNHLNKKAWCLYRQLSSIPELKLRIFWGGSQKCLDHQAPLSYQGNSYPQMNLRTTISKQRLSKSGYINTYTFPVSPLFLSKILNCLRAKTIFHTLRNSPKLLLTHIFIDFYILSIAFPTNIIKEIALSHYRPWEFNEMGINQIFTLCMNQANIQKHNNSLSFVHCMNFSSCIFMEEPNAQYMQVVKHSMFFGALLWFHFILEPKLFSPKLEIMISLIDVYFPHNFMSTST